jgi:catechol 2,3-dioxygenase-like lactoylglutathione lyase family enzyme
MIGRLQSVVLDCPDPQTLSKFYAELLGMPIVSTDDDWIGIGDESGHLSFQLAPDHQPPRWPDPNYPQQFHLDITVDDITVAEDKVLSMGAARLPGGGETFRVYADPAGHPFCLCWG